ILRANQFQRKLSESFYWGLTTRTVQESKLYPVSAYIAGSYLNAWYRWPELIRRVGDAMSPEDIGERARMGGMSINSLTTYLLLQFFSGGRQILIDMGLVRPADALDDLMYIYDFAERVLAAYHRNHYHVIPQDANMKNQIHSTLQTERLENEAIGVSPGDRLHSAFAKFMPAVSTYGFLSHCECRLSFFNHGPYPTNAGHQMLVRDMLDLAECDLPWMDGIAAEIPYNNLTAVVVMKDTDFYIVDDFGSFEARPAYDNSNLVAVGLYTSDYLSDGYIPVHMDSADDLADILEDLSEKFLKATADLWQTMAGWTRTQMLEAGLLVYSGVGREFAHIAGVYEQADWWEVDDQARRFYPLLNDEYGNAIIGELVGLLSLSSQQWSPHHIERFRGGRSEMWTPIPYSVLADDDWTSTVGPMSTGGTDLPPKTGMWQTTQGKLTLEECNRRAREFRPANWDLRWYDDDVFLKSNPEDPRLAWPAAGGEAVAAGG
ncbi:MAG: hypothetical protein J2P23_15290, partial [Microlunatus sp.]|nr:hypothetical protein [Microlunatus sp.]